MSDLSSNYKIQGWKKYVFSVQHFIAMFGATVLVPLLTGIDPLLALFTAGLGTLLFHTVTGFKVPVFLGSSFAFIAPIVIIRDKFGDLAYSTGAIAVAGLAYLLFALLVKLLGYEKIKKLFPPVVTGSMIIIIGLSLSPVAVQWASSNWLISLSTLVAVIFFSTFFKGFFSMIPVLMGVLVGYTVAVVTGNIDFQAVTQANWIGLPKFVFPKFDISAILMTLPLAIATFMEHVGDITTNGAVVGKDFVKDPGLHRTLIGDGLATSLAGMLGGPANTTYSENTGVLALTKVYDPSVIRGAAILAIILAFFSKFGSVLQTIPQSVIGGVSLVLFGMIASVGIRTLVNEKVDFANSKNLLVGAVMLTLGIGGASLTFGNIELKGVALSAIAGIILNLILPDKDKKKIKA